MANLRIGPLRFNLSHKSAKIVLPLMFLAWIGLASLAVFAMHLTITSVSKLLAQPYWLVLLVWLILGFRAKVNDAPFGLLNAKVADAFNAAMFLAAAWVLFPDKSWSFALVTLFALFNVKCLFSPVSPTE